MNIGMCLSMQFVETKVHVCFRHNHLSTEDLCRYNYPIIFIITTSYIPSTLFQETSFIAIFSIPGGYNVETVSMQVYRMAKGAWLPTALNTKRIVSLYCDYECAFAAKLTIHIFIADFELFPLSLRRNTWEDKVPTID